MSTRIQRWGNGQGLRLSKTLLTQVDMNVGDEVEAAVSNGTLVITPVRRIRGGHVLRTMVRRIPKDEVPSEAEWGNPVGREVW